MPNISLPLVSCVWMNSFIVVISLSVEGFSLPLSVYIIPQKGQFVKGFSKSFFIFFYSQFVHIFVKASLLLYHISEPLSSTLAKVFYFFLLIVCSHLFEGITSIIPHQRTFVKRFCEIFCKKFFCAICTKKIVFCAICTRGKGLCANCTKEQAFVFLLTVCSQFASLGCQKILPFAQILPPQGGDFCTLCTKPNTCSGRLPGITIQGTANARSALCILHKKYGIVQYAQKQRYSRAFARCCRGCGYRSPHPQKKGRQQTLYFC